LLPSGSDGLVAVSAVVSATASGMVEGSRSHRSEYPETPLPASVAPAHWIATVRSADQVDTA